MKKNLLVLAGALLVGSGVLASCGGGKNPTNSTDDRPVVKLKVWSANEDLEFLRQAEDKFQKANTDKKYEFTNEPVSEGDALTNVQKDLATTADVFHFAGDQLVTLVKNSALYEIPKAYVDGLVNEGLDASTLSVGQIDSKQYGIPFTPNTYYMHYDKSVYTADDIKSLDNMLKVDVKAKNANYTTNLAFDEGNSWYFQSLMFSAGAKYDETAGTITGEKAENAVKFAAKMAAEDKIVKAGGTKDVGTNCAAVITGSWDANAIKEKLGDNYACAALPAINIADTETPWLCPKDYKQIGIKSTTAVPADAAKFAAFLTSAEIQDLRYDARLTVPTNLKAAGGDSSKFDGVKNMMKNCFEQPSSVYDINGYWGSFEAFWTELKVADTDDKALTALTNFNKVLSDNVAANSKAA